MFILEEKKHKARDKIKDDGDHYLYRSHITYNATLNVKEESIVEFLPFT